MSINIDWDDLSFRLTPTKTMFLNHCEEGGLWGKGEFLPFGNISLSPAAAVLNYGQGLFEGLKAYRTRDNRVLLFRPNKNAKRLANGAQRMCMPAYPEDQFMEAVCDLVRANINFVPPYGKGALYIRPCLWGTGAILGVAPALEYTFMIYASPVGNYYAGDLEPIKLMVTNEFHRAAPKGVGHVKFIGNYTGGLEVSNQAKEAGYNGCIFLDACEEKYIEEVGTSNFFCIVDGKLLTPSLGSILPGITRESIIYLAREHFAMEVEECKITVDKALQAEECFCSGTAAVITPIGLINYKGKDTTIENFKVGKYTRLFYDYLTGLQRGDIEDEYNWTFEVELD